jgi:hypothetical protein
MSFSPAFSLPRPGLPSRPMASAVLAVMTLAGCASSAGPSAAPSAGTTTVPSSAGNPSLPLASKAHGDTITDAALAMIAADAATVAGVDPASVAVVSVKPMTWTDGSLGCPKPGVMYTQVVVPGFRVIVRAGDQKLDYRVGHAGTAKRCESGTSTGSDG